MENYREKVDLYFELKDSPESTRESYWRRMSFFLNYIDEQDKAIEQTSEEDIQRFILYLKRERNLAASTINNYISAVKFFYTYVLEKEWNALRIPRMKRKTKLPVIPTKEEIVIFINATGNVKHKTFMALLYGSGLRVSELAKLKIGDICSKSMTIRVEDAKHGTNRYTILSETALQLLRLYFKQAFANNAYTLDDWLFPGRNPEKHISVKTIKNTILKIRDRLAMDARVSSHTLRHCFSTHALEDGVDPVYIQQLLGHKSIKTTQIYLHMTSKSLMGIKSPLDQGGRKK